MQEIDRLLEKQCYIIDFLPQQVPAECGGQFFEVENYFLNKCGRYGLKDKFIRIILKLMCYYRVAVFCEKWIEQPTPAQVVEIMEKVMNKHFDCMNMLFPECETLIQLDSDCMYLSIYNADNKMCCLLEQLAWSEGLFFRNAVLDEEL